MIFDSLLNQRNCYFTLQIPFSEDTERCGSNNNYRKTVRK